jgi:GTP-binding protein EngB required for normal cell division
MQVKSAKFITSNTDYLKCPPANMTEFAFIGRSNVGKSSLINSITFQKGLAKTSQTPGKTQLINHFLINDNWYLVDLPGYGYAKVSKEKRREFEKMIFDYLFKREKHQPKNTTTNAPTTLSHKKPRPINSYLSNKNKVITINSPTIAAQKTALP